ncbi:MAG: hypothetical protein RL757_102, partial [Bacteroidota bacterium]
MAWILGGSIFLKILSKNLKKNTTKKRTQSTVSQ